MHARQPVESTDLTRTRRNVAVAVAVVVVLLALVLRWETAQHTITGLASKCAISKHIDCDKVQASNYASIFSVSLSVWAVVGHLTLIAWLLSGRVLLAAILATFNLVVALYMAYVSLFVIDAICLYCTAMQVGIVALAILLIPRTRAAKTGALALPGMAAGLLVLLGFLGEAYAQEQSELLKDIRMTTVPRVRFDVDGSPILGNPDTPHSALLFLDFGCPVCASCFAKADRMVRKYPRRIHFIVKHYPLDSTCNRHEHLEFHKGACNAAFTAAAAARAGQPQGERAVEVLFRTNDFYPQVLDRLGTEILKVKDWDWKEPAARALVLRDIEDARALKISSIPHGFLDGKPRDPLRIDKWLRGLEHEGK